MCGLDSDLHKNVSDRRTINALFVRKSAEVSGFFVQIYKFSTVSLIFCHTSKKRFPAFIPDVIREIVRRNPATIAGGLLRRIPSPAT